VIVRISHVRKARLCNRGAREWFARQGWNWQEFLDNGIDADLLIATGDPYALRAVEAARDE
jgi:hypothetical protein